MMRILAIANIFNPAGGAEKHNLNVLKELAKMGDEVILYTPSFFIEGNYEFVTRSDVIKDLEKSHVNIHHTIYDMIDKFKEKREDKQSSFARRLNSYLGFIKFQTVYFNWNNLGEDSEYIKKLDDVNADVIYDMHEHSITLRLSYHIAKKLNKPLVKLLQLEPFGNSFGRGYRKFMGLSGLVYDTLIWAFYKFDRKAYELAMRDGVLKGIAAVSEAPVYLSKIDEIAKKYGVKLRVFKVGYAFDKDLLYKYRRTRDKENYAVFFSNLLLAKGVFELPKIADLLDSKIIVFGAGGEREKKIITSHPKIEYRGFRPIEEIYDTVSKAKVLIYPSHRDSFSLVVLDTLALGTSVVAYDIPVIRFVYQGLKPVKVVKEYDIISMAKMANQVMNMSDEEYESEHNDKKVKEFLELHSSWANVARETHELLSFFI